VELNHKLRYSAITCISIIVPPCRRATSNNAKIEFRRCARMRERGAQLVNADRPQVQCLETPRRRGWPTPSWACYCGSGFCSFSSCRSDDRRRALRSRRNAAPREFVYALRCARSGERELAFVVERRRGRVHFHVIAFSLATPRFSTSARLMLISRARCGRSAARSLSREFSSGARAKNLRLSGA